VKSDRQTYSAQYLPSGGLARMIDHGLPLARGDTGSEGIAQLICHCEQRLGLPMQSNQKDVEKDCFDKKYLVMTDWRGLSTRSRSHPDRSEGSATVNETLRPEKAGLRMTDNLYGYLPRGKPPTGFSELDVGEVPGVECDVGRTLDEGVSSELETTKLIDDEVRDGWCLTMDNRRFQLCQT
jgi:hypothetical protein